jgi:hypothetical protein
MDTLGKIRSVDVRTFWKHEATDFTPWLANEENIALLGEAIGIELEVENTEVAVGPYAADIVARDTGSGRYVVIENQLGKINHDHLGKLITYGAALDAETVVLIATEFTEEHQKALDWLNEHTSEELGFYGVRLELWRIDDSRPAARFTVLSKPATATRKAARASASEELTPTRKLQLEFWTEFAKKLSARKEISSTQTPRGQYWYNVSLGRRGVHLSNIASFQQNKIGVRVYIHNIVSDVVLPQLEKEREAIEKEIGESLDWNPHPENRDKTIVLIKDTDLDDRQKWAEHLNWLVDKTIKFRRAFVPRLAKIDLTPATEQESEDETIR